MSIRPHRCESESECKNLIPTLEQAAQRIAELYLEEYEDCNSTPDFNSQTYKDFLMKEYMQWKTLTHETYLYYKNLIDMTENCDTI